LKGIATKIESQVSLAKVLRRLNLKNNLFVFTNLLCKALDKSLLYKYCKDEAFILTQFLTSYFSKYFQHTKNQKICS
jgi:hypothetical protein